MTQSKNYQIGLLIYPGMTQLDLTAPHQVFALLPNTDVHLLWKTLDPVTSSEGMTILPTTSFRDCPPLDVLCVPGGNMGQVETMQDVEVLDFLQECGKTAKYITSVCTGSLILAAAGLLQGYRAACHWAFREQLALFGVDVGTERVVVDRDRITGGGVTAGLDFALVVTKELFGENMAKTLQLLLEYNPAPPFDTGSPEGAGDALVAQVKGLGKELLEAATVASQKMATRLNQNYSGA